MNRGMKEFVYAVGAVRVRRAEPNIIWAATPRCHASGTCTQKTRCLIGAVFVLFECKGLPNVACKIQHLLQQWQKCPFITAPSPFRTPRPLYANGTRLHAQLSHKQPASLDILP